jgi:uncharacterized ubiquitin-like protein YukD
LAKTLNIQQKEIEVEFIKLPTSDKIIVLSKIERGERTALKGMLPILAKTLNIQQKEIEVEFIKAIILSEVGNLKFLKIGLEETINIIKGRK